MIKSKPFTNDGEKSISKGLNKRIQGEDPNLVQWLPLCKRMTLFSLNIFFRLWFLITDFLYLH